LEERCRVVDVRREIEFLLSEKEEKKSGYLREETETYESGGKWGMAK